MTKSTNNKREYTGGMGHCQEALKALWCVHRQRPVFCIHTSFSSFVSQRRELEWDESRDGGRRVIISAYASRKDASKKLWARATDGSGNNTGEGWASDRLRLGHWTFSEWPSDELMHVCCILPGWPICCHFAKKRLQRLCQSQSGKLWQSCRSSFSLLMLLPPLNKLWTHGWKVWDLQPNHEPVSLWGILLC